MIRLNHVSKVYQIGETKVYALKDASLHVREGEFVSIIGPSGSGKSTMMNIIGCLDTADEGEYFLDGQLVEEYSERELTRIRSKKIGFIFQNFNLIGNLTAEENVELPLIYQKLSKEERRIRVRDAFEKVGLSDRRGHKPYELSGGQQQRVAIARAIAASPSLFLADEPTGNLDSVTGKEVMAIFQKLNEEGKTIILITHDDTVARRAERKIRILDGQVRGEEICSGNR